MAREGLDVEFQDIRNVENIQDIQGGTLNVVNAGTVDQVRNIQHGTLELVRQVTDVVNVQHGTVDVLRSGTVNQVQNIQHGTLELVRQVTDVVNLQHGTIDQQKGGTVNVVDEVTNLKHGTIDQQKGGTINVVDTVTNLQHGTIDQQKGGTINVVQEPRTDTNATIASSFTVDGTDQAAGTFDTSRFDSFTAFFQTQGAHGGTFTVEHQMRPSDAGSWYTDGQDGSITTDLVASINHKAQQYRPSLTNVSSGPSATVTVEGYGN